MTAALISDFDIIRCQLKSLPVGQESLIERLLVALVTGGHILIEGSPGLAKTRAVKCFASQINADFVRIQATPDLLPADLTGTNIYNQTTASFNFIQGPLFKNIILVDEINRAPPKVQSALLEAMGEKQISSSGVTRTLDEPFMVVATQNPIEHEGTYPLPEAQLDRFMFFVNIALPDPHLEKSILDLVLAEEQRHSKTGTGKPSDSLLRSEPCLTSDGTNKNGTTRIGAAEIEQARDESLSVHLSDAVRDYIVRITTATRGYGHAGKVAINIEHPSSPRGSINLARSSQASAWLLGRDHVVPEDVMLLAPDILPGRMGLNYQAQAEGRNAGQLVHEIIEETTVV